MERDLEFYCAVLTATFPQLKLEEAVLLPDGWDSVAVEVNGRLVFKFPRHERAAKALAREQRVLALVRPHLSLRTPELTLHDGPPLFSRHEKIPGEHLLPADYSALNDTGRAQLAEQLAEFYAQFHALDPASLVSLPPVPLDPQATVEQIARDLDPVLPEDLRAFAARALAAFERQSPDPHGQVFGFMDGHCWNMAFDRERGRLNGIFDFADARVAPLHQEFVCSNFIDRDLTARIIASYERRTGRAIERDRVELLSSMLFLTELAGHANYPDKVPQLIATLRAWAN